MPNFTNVPPLDIKELNTNSNNVFLPANAIEATYKPLFTNSKLNNHTPPPDPVNFTNNQSNLNLNTQHLKELEFQSNSPLSPPPSSSLSSSTYLDYQQTNRPLLNYNSSSNNNPIHQNTFLNLSPSTNFSTSDHQLNENFSSSEASSNTSRQQLSNPFNFDSQLNINHH
ncbi:hypothetical protein HK099_002197, partial [Clydaea vesicula]